MRIVTFDEFKQKVSALPENQGATELQIYNAWDETFGKPQRQAMAEADGPVAYSVDQAQKMLGAGVRTVGQGIGSESVEDFGQDVIDQQDQDIAAGNYQSQYKGSFRENLSEGGVKQGAGWAFEKALENVAYSGGALAGGALAAITAPLSAPLSLFIGGATVAGSGLGVTGETALEMEEKGVDVNPGLAIGAGVIGGTLERFGLGRLFPSSKLAGMTGKELVTELAEKGHKDAAKVIAKEIVKRTGAEIGAEVGQEGTIVGASALAGSEYDPDELIDRAVDTMVVSGTLTAPYSVTGTIRDSMATPTPTEAAPEQPKSLEELRQEQLLVEESLIAQAETAEQQAVEAVAAQGGDALDMEFAKSETRREYTPDIAATAKALRETNQLAQTETEKALAARDELQGDIEAPKQTESAVITQPVERTELFARQTEQPAAEVIDAPTQETAVQTNQATTLKTNQEPKPVLQNRDRRTQASIEQMNNIAANPDYGRLGFSRDFGNGAPVIEPGAAIDESNLGKADYAVTGEGRRIPVQYAVVEADQLLPSNRSDGSPNTAYETGVEGVSRAIAGNGRVAGLQGAFTKGTAEQYKQALIDDAELTGINPQTVQTMQKPVLVRVMPKEEITSNIGDESNTSGVSQLSPSEQARNDAQRVDAAQIPVSDEGAVTRQAAQAFIATMPQSERGSLMDGSEPNRKAYERLENLIFSEAFESPELLRLQADATDTEVKNIMAGLRVAAAKLARLKGAGDLDIRDLVREAAEVAVNAKRSGRKLADYIQQSDLQQSPEIMPILRMMVENSRSAKKIGQSLSDMADMFYAESQRGGADMFGTVEQRNRQQLMGESFNDEQASTADIEQQGRPGIDDASTERGLETGQAENTSSEDGAQSNPQPSEELTLQPQTQAEIDQQQAEQAKTQQEAVEAERKASEREQADKDRNDFDLTGSDSKRDVMAAQGQNELDMRPETAGQSTNDQETQAVESTEETEDTLPDIEPETEVESSTSQPTAPIADFGEKIEGARKDFASKMADAKEKNIAAVPLSESWPESDYQSLVDNGADKMAVGFARALREEIPSKPRVSWKLKGWAEKVEASRDIAESIIAGDINLDALRQKFEGQRSFSRQADYIFGRAELYAEFGHEKSLKGLKFYKAHYAALKTGDKLEKDVTKWVIERPAGSGNSFSNMPYTLASAETKAAALDQFRKIYSELGQKKEAKAVRFDIYSSRRNKSDVFIAKKIGKNVVRIQDGFETVKEARDYLKNNQEALEQKLERMKDVPDMRKETNAPRVGIDHRNGGDVPPEQFSDSFGFRGVQFGNFVEQGRRQQDLNDSYDALMDLAGILNIPPKALSLNGELGLAFGARGKGGKRPAKAHYESGNVVINLTKKSGAGSLAHEWWHSLDNYFSRQGGGDGFVTDNPYQKLEGVRPEAITAFKEVNAAINRTRLRQRSDKLDATRTKPYWGTNLEMSARSFESYVIEKLNDQGASSDYLANIVGEDYWNAAANLGMEKEGTYPYPEAAEVPEIRSAFDSFFEVVETRETDKGVEIYEPLVEYAGYESETNNLQVRQSNKADNAAQADDAGRGQLDLFLGSEADKKQSYADLYGTVVRAAPVTTLRAASDRIADEGSKIWQESQASAQRLADILSSIRKDAQESFFAVATDESGKILRVMRHSKGTANASMVYPIDVIAEVASIDGVYALHFAHNHPTGNPEPSDADVKITNKLNSMLDGTGIIPGHHIVIGSQSWDSVMSDAGFMASGGKLQPVRRTVGVPVTERRFTKRGELGEVISSPKAARMMVSRHENALFLLNNKNAPVGIIPMTTAEMGKLREGGQVNRILSGINKTNARSAIIKTNDREAAANLAKFLNRFDELRVLDWIDGEGNSDAERSSAVTDARGPFLSMGDTSGISLSQASQTLNQDKRLARAISKGKLKVVQSGSDIPESANLYGSDDAIQGAYLNGTAYVVADGNSEQSITSTAWHELTHAVMDTQGDTFITPEVKQKLFKRLDNQIKLARNSKEGSPLKRAVARAENAGTTDAKFLEEVAGYLVTDYVNQSDSLTGSIRQWVQDLIAAIQSAVLRFSGIQVGSVTGAELNAIAKAYADYVTLSDRGRGEQTVEAAMSEDDAGILYSRPAPASTMGPSNFSAPEENLLATVITKTQDKFKVLKDLQANIKKSGGTVTETNDAYRAEELFHGKAENDIRLMREQFIEPLVKVMADSDIDQASLDKYLYAKHAPERNAQIAKINPAMKDGGSGMTNAEAAAVIAEVSESGKQNQYDAAAGLVYEMLQTQRDMIRDNQLEEDGVLDAWESAYEFYVPLKGWSADTEGDGIPATGSGFNIGGKETKRALGRSTEAASPSSYAISDTTRMIIRKRKNEVGNALLKLIEDNPNKAYWQVFTDDNPETDRRLMKVKDPETGEMVDQVRETAIPMAMLRDRYFTTKRDGKVYYMKLEDERLMRAMKNLGPETNNILLRTLGGINRILSALNTSYSPEFVISNFSRDLQTAILNLQAEQSLEYGKAFGQKLGAKTVKDTPTAMRAIYASLRNKKLTGKAAKWQEAFDDFRAAGAKTGYFDMKDLNGQARELEQLITMAKGGIKGNALKFAKQSAEVVENINQAVENAVRLSAYVNAIEAGISKSQAASLAKNMTVNFNRRGEIGTLLNSLYMFANASIQGTANFARTMLTFKGDGSIRFRNMNNAQRIAAGIVAGSYFLGMLNRLIAGDDDDGENWYNKVPDYVKERNIVIMKSMFGGEQNGEYWKIPLPYGYNVFSVMGTGMESVFSGAKSPVEASSEMVLAVMGSFSPIGFQESGSVQGVLLKNAAPTVVKPIVDIALNENFMGSSIYNENFPFGTPKPDSSLARRSTPEAYKAFASWLNEVSGGSEYRPGAIDVNPDVLNYVADYFGGSAYSFFGTKAPDFGIRTFAGIDMEAHKTPFISRISGKVLPYEDQDKFYDRRNEINQLVSEYKAISGAERLKFSKEYGAKIRLAGLIKQTEAKLKLLRKRRDNVYAQDLPMKQRDLQLKAIEAEMKAAIDKFNKEYAKASGRQ